MKNFTAFLICLASFNVGFGQDSQWGTAFSDAIISRYQPTINTMTNKDWDHSNSIILHAMEKVYTKTQNKEYLKYIQGFADDYIAKDGSISDLNTELDGIHPGVICLFLYEETGKEKYKKAAQNMRDFLIGESSPFNKTPDGGFWHKNNDHYDNVMTVDGAYMSNPFLVKYGVMFEDQEAIDVGASQTLLVASRTFDIKTKLPYHGWDYSKKKSWAHPITGTSSEVWSRSIGWYSMAITDILEFLPKEHSDYEDLLFLFQEFAQGIIENQNPETGLWHQMVTRPVSEANYPETSGTGMMIYALKKGTNNGWLDSSYEKNISKAWNGLQPYIKTYSDGLPMITSFNPGMGIKNSVEDYNKVRPVSCPSKEKKQHPHGYCAILMAASVME